LKHFNRARRKGIRPPTAKVSETNVVAEEADRKATEEETVKKTAEEALKKVVNETEAELEKISEKSSTEALQWCISKIEELKKLKSTYEAKELITKLRYNRELKFYDLVQSLIEPIRLREFSDAERKNFDELIKILKDLDSLTLYERKVLKDLTKYFTPETFEIGKVMIGKKTDVDIAAVSTSESQYEGDYNYEEVEEVEKTEQEPPKQKPFGGVGLGINLSQVLKARKNLKKLSPTSETSPTASVTDLETESAGEEVQSYLKEHSSLDSSQIDTIVERWNNAEGKVVLRLKLLNEIKSYT
jgi:predicted glycosyl hydrolase (DUF1957 family)